MKPYKPEKLPPPGIDWAAFVSLIGQSNAALARYDGILQGIVNPRILLSPLTTQEAVLSSRIEGTQATLEEVMAFEANQKEEIAPSKYADIQEIINYRQAMNYSVDSLDKRPLCLNLFRELHAILLDSVRGKNKAPGEFRRIQNYIGPYGGSIEEATFVPPTAERIMPSMGDWETYLHFEEKDPLVQLAIARAQFELIHPFLDGNGRLGRMLIPLFLYEKRLLSSPMFYLSAYFEKNRQEYYTRLNAVSRNCDWNGWITFFLRAVIHQARENSAKARRILALYERMKREAPDITHSQFVIQTIDALFDRPIFQTGDFMLRSGIGRVSASRILGALKSAGIITTIREARGRQGAVYVFEELLRITENLD